MKLQVVAAACLVAAAGCGGVPASTASPLTPDQAVAVAVHADDVLRAASGGQPVQLASVLGGRLLVSERVRLQARREHQSWTQESLVDRRAVHVDATARPPAVVLFIRTRSGAAIGARQWSVVLGQTASHWVVVDAHDLPPPQWWPL